MMESIFTPKHALTTLALSILLTGCRESAEEKFSRECPYPNIYTNQHHLILPVTITPHQIKYQVGDTIHVDVTFSDSMLDYNTKEHFLIQNFPFDVGVKLWGFDAATDGYFNGFRYNAYSMDSAYFQRYDYNADRTDVIFVDLVKKNNAHHFSMKIILQQAGRYIFQFEDFIARYPVDLYEEKISHYTFEGKCPTFGVRPVCMIQGDNHNLSFEPELLYIDKEIFFDLYSTITIKNAWQSPFGSGGLKWEFSGTYGFEVE